MTHRTARRRARVPLIFGGLAAFAAAAALLATLLLRRRHARVERHAFVAAIEDSGIIATAGLTGLSGAEVARLAPQRDLAAEQKEDRRRFFRRVVRTSIFNIFSINLFGNIALMWALGSPTAAITSTLMLFLNIGIRGVTMLDARRRLDTAMAAVAPQATVIRDGAPRSVDPAEIVPGDLVLMRPGDEILAAGEVIRARGLAVASLGGGEVASAQPIEVGETVARGAYCAAGTGVYRAGEGGWQPPDAAAARYHLLPPRPSPFQRVLNTFLVILFAIHIIFAGVIFAAAVTRDLNLVSEPGRNAFSLIANIAPTGLFFVLIAGYAMGARRIASIGVMAREAEAIEELSQVSLVCLNQASVMSGMTAKVTLLDGDGGAGDVAARRILGDALRSLPLYSPAGARLDETLRGAPRQVAELGPFLQEAGWFGATFDEPDFRLTFVLGQPAVLQRRLTEPQPQLSEADQPKAPPARVKRVLDRWNRLLTPLEDRIAGGIAAIRPPRAEEAGEGLTFLCGYTAEPLPLRDARGRPQLPRKLIPLAQLAVYDDVRPDVADAIRDLQAAGIDVRLLSPDDEAETAALAAKLGLDASQAVSGVTPDRQKEVVDALESEGHIVALVGSSLADIPAMAAAACGVALPGRSQAVTGNARLVLLDGSLGPLKDALIIGQRLVNGALGTLKLSLSQALAFALMLALMPLVDMGQSPIRVAHAGMLALFTIGLPNVVLSAWSAAGRLTESEIRDRLLRFALPIGATLAVMAVGLYVAYRPAQRSYAQMVVAYAFLGAGWLRVLFLLPPNRFWAGASPVRGDPRVLKTVLVVAGVFLIFLSVPFLAGLYDLTWLTLRDYAVVAGVVTGWALLLLAVWRFVWRPASTDSAPGASQIEVYDVARAP